MPAFHELKKTKPAVREDIVAEIAAEASKVETPKPAKPKLHQSAAANTTPVRPNVGFDATVITDTKANRFRLFPAIVTSMKSWWEKVRQKRKKKKVPKYVLPETHRRKGVIQKATSKTGTLFTADNETLKEQIRRRQAQANSELDDELDIEWSPYTEPGYGLLAAPESEAEPEPAPDVTENVTVEYRRPRMVAAEPAARPVEKRPPAEPPAPPATPKPAPPPEEPPHEKPAIPKPKIISPTQSVETAPEPPAAEPAKPTPPTRRGASPISRFDTNTLTVILLITVIGFVAILFASRVIMQQLQTWSGEEIAVTQPTESILPEATVTPLTVSADSLDQLPELISTGVENAPAGLVELAIIAPTGDELTPAYLFETLRFRTLATLRQSLTASRFVTVNHSTPAILVQFVDQNTVRGGLLDWEANLPGDVRVLYDIPVEATAAFTDTQVQGVDVRVLEHDERVVLVYGIIGDNTALIAPTLASFSQIIELTNPD